MKLPAILLAVLAAAPAFAQQPSQEDELKKLPPLTFKEESVGNFSTKGVPGIIPKVEVKGFVSGTPVTIDEAFTTKNENTPPAAPFRIYLPKDKEIFFTAGGKKSGVPELVKVMTASPDKKAVEILRFVSLTIPLQATPEDRLKLCAYLLKSQIPAISKGYEKVAFLEAYATKVAGNDAACVHAHMTSTSTGEHYAVKLVGILHPKQPGGVMAFLMANTALSEIKNPGDLSSKGVALPIIHSVGFIDPAKK